MRFTEVRAGWQSETEYPSRAAAVLVAQAAQKQYRIPFVVIPLPPEYLGDTRARYAVFTVWRNPNEVERDGTR